MILKSYEIKKNTKKICENNFFLLYGENTGLKKDIKNFIKNTIKQNDKDLEIITLHENEIIDNDESFYNFIYSGSLFGSKKIINIFDATDKITEKIKDVYEKYPESVFFIIFSDVLDKKSKLRNFFEYTEKVFCVPCYLDNARDLETIAAIEFKKEKISISRESLNLLIEKSNNDRNNLRNEMEKIKTYSLGKKNIEFDEVKTLINFSGDYKSDVLVNECLCGNVSQFKKVLSELYTNSINQILLLRILSNKVQRLLRIKSEQKESPNLDSLINSLKPSIFWKEKPLVKKQLSIWSFSELQKIISGINATELLCKKNPQTSKAIFFNFFLKICTKSNNFS